MNYKLSYLLSQKPDCLITLDQAQTQTGLSAKEVQQQLGELQTSKQKTKRTSAGAFYVPKISAKQWASWLTHENEVIYSEEERRALIYLLSYSQFEVLSLFHFQDFLEISKGTAIADIKKLRNELSDFDIRLEYTRKTGFLIEGEEASARRLAKNFVAELLQSNTGKFGLLHWINQQNLDRYASWRDTIQEQTKKAGLEIVPSRIDEVALFLAFSADRMITRPLQKLEDVDLMCSLTAYQAGQLIYQQFFTDNNQNEAAYLTIILMTIVQGEIQDIQLDQLLSCSAEIIHRMENLSAIEFSNFRELLMNLFYHLVPAYFRIKYGFYLPNVLIGNIQMEYAEIYRFTKDALLPLEKLTGETIPEEEVGFFSILFGGEIARQKEEAAQEEVRALIVCPNGISSSLILQTELKKIFPTIHFEEASSVDQLQSISEESYDVIFSTIQVETAKRAYLVKPLMSQLEKNQLINRVQQELLIPGFSLPSAEEIVDALLPYITVKKGVTKEKLYKTLNKKMNRLIEKKEDRRPMLTELITPEMIQLSDQPLEWEEAIRLTAQPLVTQGKIEDQYIDAMINKVKQYGPFIHIGKGIALPHARPEDGVNELGMSLLKVQEPVLLVDDEKHAIRLFVCLAAVDNEAHLRALSSLTKLLSNKENLENLLNATTKEEILSILSKGENE
ncbi:BglG family transcription antiterminator [Candidatus Enterococcus ferrettii]|uniref:Ascorbate-specific PTS system EIIA component n=1 Tax=Candidatus Enterococcus ferrettii TaxID=2815324 RepID=A0ABV0EN24_9ENTE|nr:BglG family transcription antiterminator [Enterococcus sp. 665A]MBO1338129.1 BglG family transcription antiterminator [Enterococcus sp. 665A]